MSGFRIVLLLFVVFVSGLNNLFGQSAPDAELERAAIGYFRGMTSLDFNEAKKYVQKDVFPVIDMLDSMADRKARKRMKEIIEKMRVSVVDTRLNEKGDSAQVRIRVLSVTGDGGTDSAEENIQFVREDGSWKAVMKLTDDISSGENR